MEIVVFTMSSLIMKHVVSPRSWNRGVFCNLRFLPWQGPFPSTAAWTTMSKHPLNSVVRTSATISTVIESNGYVALHRWQPSSSITSSRPTLSCNEKQQIVLWKYEPEQGCNQLVEPLVHLLKSGSRIYYRMVESPNYGSVNRAVPETDCSILWNYLNEESFLVVP